MSVREETMTVREFALTIPLQTLPVPEETMSVREETMAVRELALTNNFYVLTHFSSKTPKNRPNPPKLGCWLFVPRWRGQGVVAFKIPLPVILSVVEG
jgi:hypothetical protein